MGNFFELPNGKGSARNLKPHHQLSVRRKRGRVNDFKGADYPGHEGTCDEEISSRLGFAHRCETRRDAILAAKCRSNRPNITPSLCFDQSIERRDTARCGIEIASNYKWTSSKICPLIVNGCENGRCGTCSTCIFFSSCFTVHRTPHILVLASVPWQRWYLWA